MKKFPIPAYRPFIGIGKPHAWAIVKNNIVVIYAYMGDFEHVTQKSPIVLESKKKKYAGLHKKEIAARMNFQRFMSYRYSMKEQLRALAENLGGALFSGYVHEREFIVKREKKDS